MGARTQAKGRVSDTGLPPHGPERQGGDSSTRVHAAGTGHRSESTPQPLTVLSHQPGPQRGHVLPIQGWANPPRQRAWSAAQSWQSGSSGPRLSQPYTGTAPTRKLPRPRLGPRMAVTAQAGLALPWLCWTCSWAPPEPPDTGHQAALPSPESPTQAGRPRRPWPGTCLCLKAPGSGGVHGEGVQSQDRCGACDLTSKIRVLPHDLPKPSGDAEWGAKVSLKALGGFTLRDAWSRGRARL